ncbi:hypothetical protein GCM10010124_03430 [Pilimelia terevasa]|uniref:Uncharacterized protein n=1 Tax=Pilimelia terevasa TaxID=53372 RepID=A0A8J3BEP3_9ACTN|nr:LuxR C-terminal-related transcriptional regulator [Pilimelia terevasa]GGK14132.1 hypothetical protein GCM10010124_03430 [Pilimelia terevasa]
MRSVLVCVRSSPAAQAVATCAARLGLSAQVRTAMSETEVIARLAERPADVILADVAVTRSDTVGFTRRVLARAPGAMLVLFGAEDPRVAAAAVAAGARALIRGTEDLVSTVAKAVLLLGMPARAAGPVAGAPVPATAAMRGANAPSRFGAPVGRKGAPLSPAEARAAGAELVADPAGLRVPGSPVPSQRDFGDPAEAARMAARGVGDYGAGMPAARRVVLTEREMQVLRGMADGKSNAEIGRELFVSEDTVKTHARRLFRKLGARDRAHAVAAGFRAGLVV